MDAHIFGEEKFSRLIGVPAYNSPAKSRLNQIKDGDHRWFTDDQNIFLEDFIKGDVSFSSIMENMQKEKEYFKGLDLGGEEAICDFLDVDLTRKARNVGLFGKNIRKVDSNKSLVSNSNAKKVFTKVINSMTEAFKIGMDNINDDDVLGFSYSSNIGHNPENYPSFVNDAENKREFLETYWDDFQVPERRKAGKDRFIFGAFRKTFDKKGKRRPAFFLNRNSGKLFEDYAENDFFGFRVRYVAGLSWYDNGYWMFINQSCLIGKKDVPFLAKHIDYTSNTILDKINATGKEAFATDVASGDYTHKIEDLEYFFDVFLKGALKTSFEDIFKVRKIAGVYYDLKGKPVYYIQKNFGRFLSGTGLTYWINVAKYLTCQILNLISYERVLKGRIAAWSAGADVITDKEIDDVDCFNKGDDALDMIKPGTANKYEIIVSSNPFIECERETVLGFDGKSLTGEAAKYFMHTRYKSCGFNLIEKREGRKPNNPMNSLFFNSIKGKLDLIRQFPTVNPELGLRLIEKSMQMVTGYEFKLEEEDKFITMKAEEETKYLLGNERQKMIMIAVSLLGLKGAHELSHMVTARDLSSLPKEVRDAIFISVPMNKIRDKFEEKYLREIKL